MLLNRTPRNATVLNNQPVQLTLLLLFTLLSNTPLGYLRQGVKKRSPLWFLYIHLSIPFIIALRLYFDFNWHIIPLTIGCAVIGQLSGGSLRKRNERG
ncbi:MAG: hypothetical protein B6I37_01275 [Desulfobacteraceae bacterium 4572_35.2]|nr:MAG: hypothetical protein B6I37_01275 [Desulfobacteraceae bacterium 4572_35.2]